MDAFIALWLDGLFHPAARYFAHCAARGPSFRMADRLRSDARGNVLRRSTGVRRDTSRGWRIRTTLQPQGNDIMMVIIIGGDNEHGQASGRSTRWKIFCSTAAGCPTPRGARCLRWSRKAGLRSEDSGLRATSTSESRYFKTGPHALLAVALFFLRWFFVSIDALFETQSYSPE